MTPSTPTLTAAAASPDEPLAMPFGDADEPGRDADADAEDGIFHDDWFFVAAFHAL